MKNAVRLFLLVLTVGLIFVLTGCKEPEPTPGPEPTPDPVITDFNVLGNWTDGGDGVYTMLTNTTDELDFTYAKATFPYAFLQSAVITEDLSVYKKLVITVEGTGTMLLKLETKDDTPAKEVGLNVTGIKGTYEWNLLSASDFLAKVDRVVIIAAPGKEESVGAITVSKLSFETTVADNYIINDGFNNIPSNVNEYNGTDEVFHFNSKWESNDEGIYEVTYEETDAVVEYTKGSGMEWSFMRTRVQGDFTNFNYVVFVVTGTAGHKLLIKPNEYNTAEAFIYLNGSEQELVIDLSELTLEQKNAIVDFKVFIAAGLAPASGEVTFHDAFMIDEYEFEAPVILTNEYNGTDKSFTLEHFYDGGDMVYDLYPNGTELVVQYEKNSPSLTYAYMYANIDGNFSGFSKIEFEMTGQSGKSILLKVESPAGNKEEQKTFDGTRQVFTFDISTMSASQLEQLNKIVLFAAPGSQAGAGEFTIHHVTFKTSDYEVATDWVSLQAGVYTFTPGETLLVNYSKAVGEEWQSIRNTLNPEAVAGLNTLTVVVKGTAGKSLLIKPNDSNDLQQTVSFTDTTPVTKVFTAESFTNIFIFAEGGIAPATGSFEIVSVTLSYVAPDLDMTTVFDFNQNWVKDTNKNTYTFDFQPSKTVVNYTKDAGGQWDWMKVVFDQKDVSGLNTLTLVLKGTEDKQILVKPNDSGALEKFVTFEDANPVTVVVYSSSFTSVFLFGEPNTAPVTGSFEILSATLSYTKDIQNTWKENDPGTYTATPNGSLVDVSYTKLAGQEWVFIKADFTPASVQGLNTVTIVLKGEAGKTVLVKVNNSIQQEVTFVDALTPMSVTISAEAITGLILFAEGGTAPVTGTFQIVSSKIYYAKPAIDFDPTSNVDVNSNWVENDADTYDFVAELDGSVTVTYAHAGWAFMKQTFDQEVVVGYNTLTIVLEGTEGKKVLVKPNDSGALETWITFGTEPYTLVSHSALGFTNVLIFAEPESNPAAGTFKIVSAVLSYEVNINSNWVENDASTYVFTTETNGSVSVAYTHNGWAFMKQTFDQEVVGGLNTMTIVLEGTEGKKVLVKPNDSGALEAWITFGAEPYTFVSTSATGFTNILIFAEPESSPATGTFKIVSASLSYVIPAIDFDPTSNVDVNSNWVENDADTYDFVAELDGSVTVTYAHAGWAFMKQTFDQEVVVGYNTLTIVLEGTEGKKVLVKPNDSGALETWITFGTEPYTLVSHSALGFTNVLIFAEPESNPAAGTFKIVSAVLSYEVNINSNWVENDASTYVFTTETNGSVSVAYTHNGWAFMKQIFDQEVVSGLNTMTITISGTSGAKILIKPNDSNALETWITLGAEPYTFVSTSATGFMNVFIFAEPESSPATGTFVIVSAVLSYK